MPRWLRDRMTWLVILAAIAAASSSYSAYKIYLMMKSPLGNCFLNASIPPGACSCV